MKELWDKFGLGGLIDHLAETVEEDTNILQSFNLFPEEVKIKRQVIDKLPT